MVNAVVAKLVGFLPGAVQPFAKAIVPAVLVAASVAVQAFVDGHWDPTALDAAIRGLVAALLVYLIPNASKA